MSGWYDPYAGLPWYVEGFFWLVLLVALSSLAQVALLRVLGARARRRSLPDVPQEDFLWVFLVPALNEEVTIADSVHRLRAVHAQHRVILVIDDGSDDRTPEILAELAGPDLVVLRRDPPHARQGKAAALNAAWAHLHEHVLTQEGYASFGTDRVLLVVVDADGRLSADAPTHFARHFGDPRVGGVQSRVRIYNRRGWLTWAQDVEFAVFGLVFQLGRTHWGLANMGGNGQANRLSALDEAADSEGPWRHRLTEDQDIGVRLIQSGWRGAQELDATVEQQGLNSVRRLYRQRTRWAQGGLESLSLMGGARRVNGSWLGRADMVHYLLTPVWQLTIGVGLVAAASLAAFAELPFWTEAGPILIFYLALSFGPGLLALMAVRKGISGTLVALLTVLPYTLYTWMIVPVLVRAVVRQLAGQTSWAKTAREPIEAEGIQAEV